MLEIHKDCSDSIVFSNILCSSIPEKCSRYSAISSWGDISLYTFTDTELMWFSLAQSVRFVLFVCLFLLYTGSIFRGKFKYPSVLPYGPVTKYNIKITLPIN